MVMKIVEFYNTMVNYWMFLSAEYPSEKVLTLIKEKGILLYRLRKPLFPIDASHTCVVFADDSATLESSNCP